MSLPDFFAYQFHPVGQGLFTSGSIRLRSESEPRFLWVYDCGTTSEQSLVDQGVVDLHESAGARKRIDLLVLSHFDKDHISGVCRLLKDFEVGTLLLPYMSLAQRLLLAFEEGHGGPDDPLRGFYLNPVDYLQGQDGPGINRVLFVPPSSNQGPPFPQPPRPPEATPPAPERRVDRQRDNVPIDGPELLDYVSDPREGDPELQEIKAHIKASWTSPAVDCLAEDGGISVRSCLWEFVPYNADEPIRKLNTVFLAEVEQKRQKLFTSRDTEREDALQELKAVYDKQFGDGSKDRNLISLFLYSGPVYPLCMGAWLGGAMAAWDWRWWLARRDWIDWLDWQFLDRLMFCDTRCGVLYTGDGYLDSPEELSKLTRYLGTVRIKRTGVFQVMHHGAIANWHSGVAKAIGPRFSVFSSDPERRNLKHPHEPVTDDFESFGPVRVNKKDGFIVFGCLLASSENMVFPADPPNKTSVTSVRLKKGSSLFDYFLWMNRREINHKAIE